MRPAIWLSAKTCPQKSYCPKAQTTSVLAFVTTGHCSSFSRFQPATNVIFFLRRGHSLGSSLVGRGIYAAHTSPHVFLAKPGSAPASKQHTSNKTIFSVLCYIQKMLELQFNEMQHSKFIYSLDDANREWTAENLAVRINLNHFVH